MTGLNELTDQLLRDIYYQTGPGDSKAEMNLVLARQLVTKAFQKVAIEQLEADMEKIDVLVERLETDIEEEAHDPYKLDRLEVQLEILEQVIVDLQPIGDIRYLKPIRKSEYDG